MIDLADAPQMSPSDTLRAQSDARLLEFTRSELFVRTFREGMELVEETAAYLDGPGRADSRRLGTDEALIYATQSMRLTTRLMQVASWLLVQRSLKEDEMSVEDARAPKYRLSDEVEVEDGLSFGDLARVAHALPGTLLDLMARSDALYKRITRLDRSLYGAVAAQDGNTVADHLSRLQAAFDRNS